MKLLSVLFKTGSVRHIFLISFLMFGIADSYDPLDPNGNITIKWDIMSWTSDGYIAIVTIFNFQKYRHIEAPGWELGWTWSKNEIIWSMLGGQTTEQGNCLKFKGNVPHCCKKDPIVVDLLPETTTYNLRTTNCCRGGVLSTMIQDHSNSVSSIQITVGQAGTTNKTVKAPKNFNLKGSSASGPGLGYTCGSTKLVKPSKFFTPDKRRFTQALMSWNVTCTYSQFLAQKSPSCCVSLSSFYSDTIVNCPTCTCGCQNKITQAAGTCVRSYSAHIASSSAVISPGGGGGRGGTYTPMMVQCTRHMCPIRVHWHVKQSYKEYWRVKITITNFNYRMNYTQWNIVVQHPNFNNLTQSFSFNYKSIPAYKFTNDTGMLWGIKYYNDMLMEAGPYGFVQSELLFRKDKEFTFDKGWAFPRRIYFNGDSCVMPPPDEYPFLPNDAAQNIISLLKTALVSLILFLI
ncbi:hypothetical protein M9H77_28833 [Catharanthus roseus]|uniref:Uncharacterized protein n=1 Tax=Catharanthus roseus TaxID=4058 RepID=A0ACC0AGQ8_CATRO|nr:hypothetical protein M9H77_28833 [Catharanthus roseus]